MQFTSKMEARAFFIAVLMILAAWSIELTEAQLDAAMKHVKECEKETNFKMSDPLKTMQAIQKGDANISKFLLCNAKKLGVVSDSGQAYELSSEVCLILHSWTMKENWLRTECWA